MYIMLNIGFGDQAGLSYPVASRSNWQRATNPETGYPFRLRHLQAHRSFATIVVSRLKELGTLPTLMSPDFPVLGQIASVIE
jgi:hypothetical protein